MYSGCRLFIEVENNVARIAKVILNIPNSNALIFGLETIWRLISAVAK